MTQNNQNNQNNQNSQMTKSATKQTMSELTTLTFMASFIALAIGLCMSYTDKKYTEESIDVTRIVSEQEMNGASIIKINSPEDLDINFDIDLEFVEQNEIMFNQHMVTNRYKKSFSIDDADIEIQDNLITINFDTSNIDESYDTDVSYYIDLDIVLPRKDWSIDLPKQEYYQSNTVVNDGEAINLNIAVNSLRVTGNFNHLNIMNPYGSQELRNIGNLAIDKLQLFANDIDLSIDTGADQVNIKDMHLYNTPQSNLELSLYDNSELLANTYVHTLTQEQTTKLANKDMSLFETD